PEPPPRGAPEGGAPARAGRGPGPRRDVEPARGEGVEVLLGGSCLHGRDLLEAREAADAPVDQLRARRGERRGLEDAIEAARAVLRRLCPPGAERRLLSRHARVLALEDLAPVIPAAHLPQVHDHRPGAGGAALL